LPIAIHFPTTARQAKPKDMLLQHLKRFTKSKPYSNETHSTLNLVEGFEECINV
jgi:hypothetical protein